MLVLGIDPGSSRTGYGCIAREGSRLRLLDAGVLAPKRGAALADRLDHLHGRLTEVIQLWSPDLVAMETVFHGVNTRSLVVLGQARGALMAAVGGGPCDLCELSPAEVKKAVTGRGGATKDQVAHMVGLLLGPASRGGRSRRATSASVQDGATAQDGSRAAGSGDAPAGAGRDLEAGQPEAILASTDLAKLSRDATDALAVAIAALHRAPGRSPGGARG